MTDPHVPANLCFTGGAPVAEAVAKISGKEMAAVEGLVAVVHCSKIQGKVERKYAYIGYRTCSAANLAFAGPIGCQYGCLGLGDCVGACFFEAIGMVEGLPVIDADRCVGCGMCVKTCPKGIISLVPKDARVLIRCSTKDAGKDTLSVCSVGCIHCLACVRACPAGAIAELEGVVRIDHKTCMDYGPSCKEACIAACEMVHILQPFHLEHRERTSKAAAG